MIDYVITTGKEYYPDDPNVATRTLFDFAVKEYQGTYKLSDEDMKNVQIVGAVCYNIEPYHQITKQIEIMIRAQFDIIIIQLSTDKKFETQQRKAITELFYKHTDYTELENVYSGRVVYVKPPQK